MIEESLRMAETLDERIRECAYHMWEASGRPEGAMRSSGTGRAR